MERKIPHLNYADGVLRILDQRALPNEKLELELTSALAVSEAIRSLAVRGAPAIGIAAAYGVAVSLRSLSAGSSVTAARAEAVKASEILAASRPTAYNLFSCLDYIRKTVEKPYQTGLELTEAVEAAASELLERDLDKSLRIGRNGLPLLPEAARVYSHCNAGGLATGGNGTSLAVVFAGFEAGMVENVWVGETRPLLQGSRLTAWELSVRHIPHKIVCDSMAADLMRRGEVDLVLLGADRVASNGDFANKIGTYSLAVLAKHHGIPFYTAAPVTTFDPSAATGADIPVEERSESEVLSFGGIRTSPSASRAFNPSFDVTPHELVTAIVTEHGVIRPPYRENIAAMLAEAGGRY